MFLAILINTCCSLLSLDNTAVAEPPPIERGKILYWYYWPRLGEGLLHRDLPYLGGSQRVDVLTRTRLSGSPSLN